MVADMAADMEVHTVADMEVDKVADKEADMVADMLADMEKWPKGKHYTRNMSYIR